VFCRLKPIILEKQIGAAGSHTHIFLAPRGSSAIQQPQLIGACSGLDFGDFGWVFQLFAKIEILKKYHRYRM
jgi:hypothetical protein